MSAELFDDLINEITAGNEDAIQNKLSELTDEQINQLFKEAAPAYKSLGTASPDRKVLASVNNLREKYLKKLITTSMVGFLFQMKDEHTVEENELTTPVDKEKYMIDVPTCTLPPDFNKESLYNVELEKVYVAKFPREHVETYKQMSDKLSEDDLITVGINFKNVITELEKVERKLDTAQYHDAIEAAIKEQSDSERVVINKFLENLFKYNADKHLKEGNNPIDDDPERVDVEELKGTHVVYDNIPPNDTHVRFTKYYEINYEKMREATKNIYNVKPDFEHAMIVYDVVDSQEEVDAFIGKYGSQSKCDIISIDLNKWVLVGPFKENRERADFYNKHNNIIKALLEQQEADNMLGEDMMKKRVKSTKVKAEKVFGKDSPQFNNYKNLIGSSDTGVNVEQLDEEKIKVVKETVVDSQTGQELTLDEDGVPTNALEVPVTTINAKTGEVKQSRIFTRAEED